MWPRHAACHPDREEPRLLRYLLCSELHLASLCHLQSADARASIRPIADLRELPSCRPLLRALRKAAATCGLGCKWLCLLQSLCDLLSHQATVSPVRTPVEPLEPCPPARNQCSCV